jgi:hypothetical protein
MKGSITSLSSNCTYSLEISISVIITQSKSQCEPHSAPVDPKAWSALPVLRTASPEQAGTCAQASVTDGRMLAICGAAGRPNTSSVCTYVGTEGEVGREV